MIVSLMLFAHSELRPMTAMRRRIVPRLAARTGVLMGLWLRRQILGMSEDAKAYDSSIAANFIFIEYRDQ